MMVSIPKNTWMRRQQCPCGDWKCFLTYEGESEETNVSSSSFQSVGVDEDSSSKQMIVSPYVGMVFRSDDDAFEYYGNFARKNGFSIRKERSRLSPNIGIHKRDFVCYRAGFTSLRRRPPSGELQRERKSVRCGCDAKLFLSKELVDGGVFQWFVVQFSNVHNHELLEDDQVRLLPAYRRIDEVAQERILLLSKAGFPIHKIYKVLEKERGIQGVKLTFVEKDVRNFIGNRKRVVQEETDDLVDDKKENDVSELLEACKATKEGDPRFVYIVGIDENDKVENVAWSYGDSIRAYTTFGDVVYFDTTYRSVAHGMVFGAFFGIDNHGKTIFFGCVLLQDETTMSFSWALQTFILFMEGKHPQTIVTDLDSGLKDAIAVELPNTKHVISIYNILPKISCWFSIPLGARYADFRNEFDGLQNVDSAEDFESRWNDLVSQYGLTSDKHTTFLFSFQTSWASPYTKDYFLAKMATSECSKSVEAFLKGVFKGESCLRGFFEQVGVSSACMFQAHGDIQYTHIRTCVPIEEHARSVLTPFAFNALQHELALAMQYAISEMSYGSYLVIHFKKMDRECTISWKEDGEEILCSCKEFESSGILCRHALRVLLMKNYFHLPEKYYLSRWRKESSLFPYDNGNGRSENDEWYKEFHSLSGTLFAESSISKERSDYIRKELRRELMRLVNEVRNFPPNDAMHSDPTPSPTH